MIIRKYVEDKKSSLEKSIDNKMNSFSISIFFPSTFNFYMNPAQHTVSG